MNKIKQRMLTHRIKCINIKDVAVRSVIFYTDSSGNRLGICIRIRIFDNDDNVKYKIAININEHDSMQQLIDQIKLKFTDTRLHHKALRYES